MSKKKILLIAVAFVIAAVGIVAASVSQKQKKMDPQELLQRFEKAAEEVLGEDIQRVSQTELVATLTYSHETDKHILYSRCYCIAFLCIPCNSQRIRFG